METKTTESKEQTIIYATDEQLVTITDILKDSSYSLGIFTNDEIARLEKRIKTKLDKKGNRTGTVECLVRKKEIQLKPEEIVRQLYIDRLVNVYNYPLDRMTVEYPVVFGTDTSKRADIVIYNKENTTAPYIIVELKKPKLTEGKEQLRSYCNATGAPMGVWSNGGEIEYYHRKDPNLFDKLRNIPNVHQTLTEIINQPYTIWDLMTEKEVKSLKRIIEEFEDEVLANAGVDVFEEAFKLIFSKLYDEWQSGTDKDEIYIWLKQNPDKSIIDMPEGLRKEFRNLEFRSAGVENETHARITKLFEDAKKKWKGIFQESDSLKLTASHLQTCITYLQSVKLFNSNLEVVDEAFEYLVNKDSKGEKGQYFTPRYVIDLCVKMLNPKADEKIIDTAAGSCGFPMHTIFDVWQKQAPGVNLFTTDKRTKEQIRYVNENVFAIDFDEKTVRVGRTLNLIAGDGETNVLLLNSLDYERWEADFNSRPDWRKIYGKGFERLEELKRNKKNGWREFTFDIVMANPPFAGDIKDRRVISKYELGKKRGLDKATKKLTKDKGWHEKISRHILFIERNLDMLKPGGRMAIVLPQGVFNNSSDWVIRNFIAEHCRILAVVGLHGNTFKPHTGTKTSVLFVQKWDDELCPKVEDYNIFFATQQLEGKNNSGEKLYWLDEQFYTNDEREKWNSESKTLQPTPLTLLNKTTTNELLAAKDVYGHPIVYHDLFSTQTNKGNHTPEGLYEAFEQYAIKENLHFFQVALSTN
ncbi:MAG: N-6 DNA methylase [Bacteriodetes bacterium]|nr:N-6 DNA methylase [Bacteroidota bacterium]